METGTTVYITEMETEIGVTEKESKHVQGRRYFKLNTEQDRKP